jgi:hypothetical protein
MLNTEPLHVSLNQDVSSQEYDGLESYDAHSKHEEILKGKKNQFIN